MAAAEETSGKARVFISCGQDLDERPFVDRIAEKLRDLGFEPLVALRQQSLHLIEDRIFQDLSDAEYVLFIDFKREPLAGGTQCRGSVFSQQELAVATYLEKDVLAFQEEGVIPRDGILGVIQANPMPFSSREQLADRVEEAVRDAKWNPESRHSLSIGCASPPYCNAQLGGQVGPARYFHLAVKNGHPTKIANNAYAYIEKVLDDRTGVSVQFERAELKWAGYTHPNARIAAGQERLLDAFWVEHSVPGQLRFNAFTDSPDYTPRLSGEGRWVMTYSVSSETVPGTKAEFVLISDGTLDGFIFKPK